MPLFKHDCTKCVYLETQVIHGRQVDWYRCPAGPVGAGSGPEGSIIGRFSDEGPDYWSAPVGFLRTMEAAHPTRMVRAALEILAKPEVG